MVTHTERQTLRTGQYQGTVDEETAKKKNISYYKLTTQNVNITRVHTHNFHAHKNCVLYVHFGCIETDAFRVASVRTGYGPQVSVWRLCETHLYYLNSTLRITKCSHTHQTYIHPTDRPLWLHNHTETKRFPFAQCQHRIQTYARILYSVQSCSDTNCGVCLWCVALLNASRVGAQYHVIMTMEHKHWLSCNTNAETNVVPFPSYIYIFLDTLAQCGYKWFMQHL